MTMLTVRPQPKDLSREFDRFFDGFFGAPFRGMERSTEFAPRVNITESDDAIKMTFEIAGMDKDDIKITLSDGVLTVSGTREFKTKEKDDGYVRSEIRTGSFSRSFTLPDTIDTDQISADYKSGMLTLNLAKLEEVKPKEIEVKVS